MNNEMIIAQMKEICRSGGPEGKREFFRELRARGLLHRRPVAMSHGEFAGGNEPRRIFGWAALLHRKMGMVAVGYAYAFYYIGLYDESRELSICTDTAACCRNSRGNRKILPVENG